MNLLGIVLHNLTFICFYVFSQNKQARKTRLGITDQRVSPICLCITTEHENDSISTSRKTLLLQVTIQHEQPPRIQSSYMCTSKIWKWQYLLSSISSRPGIYAYPKSEKGDCSEWKTTESHMIAAKNRNFDSVNSHPSFNISRDAIRNWTNWTGRCPCHIDVGCWKMDAS